MLSCQNLLQDTESSGSDLDQKTACSQATPGHPTIAASQQALYPVNTAHLQGRSFSTERFVASCDASIVVQGTELPVHSNIISMWSVVLSDCLAVDEDTESAACPQTHPNNQPERQSLSHARCVNHYLFTVQNGAMSSIFAADKSHCKQLL